jgi:hypothetical protein
VAALSSSNQAKYGSDEPRIAKKPNLVRDPQKRLRRIETSADILFVTILRPSTKSPLSLDFPISSPRLFAVVRIDAGA